MREQYQARGIVAIVHDQRYKIATHEDRPTNLEIRLRSNEDAGKTMGWVIGSSYLSRRDLATGELGDEGELELNDVDN